MIPYYLRPLFFLIWLCPLATAQQASENIPQLYQQADALFNMHDSVKDVQALDYYKKVIQTFTSHPTADTLLAEAYLKQAIIQISFQQYPEALDAYHASLKVRQQLFTPLDSLLFKNYLYIGELHYLQLNYDSAEYYFNKAQTIAQHWQEKLSGISDLYNSIGLMYISSGNYKQAHNFFQKALRIVRKRAPGDMEAIAYFTFNLALAHAKAEDHKAAITEYRALLQHQASIPYLPLYNNLGYSYEKSGNTDSAIYYLRKALYHPQHIFRVAAFKNLGQAYLTAGLTDSADFYFQTALNLGQEYLTAKNTRYAEIYMGLARVQEKSNHWQQALQYYQKAIISLTYSFEDTSIYQNPTNYDQVISILDLFNALSGKGRAFYQYHQQVQDIKSLKHALNCYQQAIKVAQHIQKSYDTDDAKLFFTAHIHPIFEEAMATVHALYQTTGDPKYVATGLNIAETGKASVLTETLKDIAIKVKGYGMDSLVQEEKRLKQKITSLRIKLAQSNDSTQSLSYQTAIADLEIALAHTIKLLQQDEKYYRLKYQYDSLDIYSVQRQITDHNTGILEYVSSPDALYIFLVTQERTDLKRIPLSVDFYEALEQVLEHLYHHQAGQPYKMGPHTVQLFQALLQPYAQETERLEKLIIIADGKLSYLPFEILSGDPASERYLIYDYIISYAYSIRLLQDAIQKRHAKSKNNILAMAPFAGNTGSSIRNSEYSLLAASGEEVEKIGGSIYKESQATKRLFLKIAGSYGILHLATHASVNSQHPLQSYIAFYPDQESSGAGFRLYTQELYNLNLDSVSLVILSACEAGHGQLIEGEGIISLARAFAYAGCPNIATTLWSANDKSTARLASSMHAYLKRGYPKDEALQQAKLDYLNSDVHPILKAPFYWANFIFIGDPEPIYNNYNYLYYIAFLIAVLAVGALLWKYHQKYRQREKMMS